MMQKIACDNCGAFHDVVTKDEMISCQYCGSAFFLEREADEVGFIQADQKFYFLNQYYRPISCQHYRYDYGVRKEWLVLDAMQQRYILTQEDEIYSLVKKCDCDMYVSLQWDSLLPNTQIEIENTRWLVTERCSLTNEHKEPLNYVYLTAVNAQLLVLIFKYDLLKCRKGQWLDPFEISF